MKKLEILSIAYIYILLASFFPLFINGIAHVQGGSLTPMLVLNGLGLPILIGLYYSRKWVVYFIKAWAFWLILFGVVRLLLMGLVFFSGAAVEADIVGQMGVGFVAISLAHVAVGWCLNRYLYSCIWVAAPQHAVA